MHSEYYSIPPKERGASENKVNTPEEELVAYLAKIDDRFFEELFSSHSNIEKSNAASAFLNYLNSKNKDIEQLSEHIEVLTEDESELFGIVSKFPEAPRLPVLELKKENEKIKSDFIKYEKNQRDLLEEYIESVDNQSYKLGKRIEALSHENPKNNNLIQEAEKLKTKLNNLIPTPIYKIRGREVKKVPFELSFIINRNKDFEPLLKKSKDLTAGLPDKPSLFQQVVDFTTAGIKIMRSIFETVIETLSPRSFEKPKTVRTREREAAASAKEITKNPSGLIKPYEEESSKQKKQNDIEQQTPEPGLLRSARNEAGSEDITQLARKNVNNKTVLTKKKTQAPTSSVSKENIEEAPTKASKTLIIETNNKESSQKTQPYNSSKQKKPLKTKMSSIPLETVDETPIGSVKPLISDANKNPRTVQTSLTKIKESDNKSNIQPKNSAKQQEPEKISQKETAGKTATVETESIGSAKKIIGELNKLGPSEKQSQKKGSVNTDNTKDSPKNPKKKKHKSKNNSHQKPTLELSAQQLVMPQAAPKISPSQQDLENLKAEFEELARLCNDYQHITPVNTQNPMLFPRRASVEDIEAVSKTSEVLMIRKSILAIQEALANTSNTKVYKGKNKFTLENHILFVQRIDNQWNKYLEPLSMSSNSPSAPYQDFLGERLKTIYQKLEKVFQGKGYEKVGSALKEIATKNDRTGLLNAAAHQAKNSIRK